MVWIRLLGGHYCPPFLYYKKTDVRKVIDKFFTNKLNSSGINGREKVNPLYGK
ncbi:hypothetical protein OEV82_00050 [Caldibacillus thermolactis]|uniref:Uncharacterized protein n=1 Tax=Pallidibacillus thermolactis TaxID=251051 RepID=A0ABT2WBI0_9BACI|nr:hypothetical protein [Pallidibacillus thermolactis]MCU9592842.1 hypothetical protein [Pallidibacillus thermolactis]